MNALPEIYWIGGFQQPAESDRLLRYCLTAPTWPENRFGVGYRQFDLARLQTWHADEGVRYCYSNNLLDTRDWPPLLRSTGQNRSFSGCGAQSGVGELL